MKGLRKYLTPFAPDQSGAAAVLYDLGGMIVICDAGGCAGNIFGFDEPRGAFRRSAVFSAGLRDMDAIMGRDDKLVQKITDTARVMLDVSFIALIGTPVPAVIGTDYAALARLIRRQTGLPVLCIDTNGTELYDRGEEKAYLALYREFAKERLPVVPGKVHVIGEALGTEPAEEQKDPLERIRRVCEAQKVIAASPAAIGAARILKERFGTPYEVTDPQAASRMPEIDCSGKRVLIVHQHVTADTLRRRFEERGAVHVTAATWFSFAEEIRRCTDVHLKEEDDFTRLAGEGGFDVILADDALKPLASGFRGTWIDLPHFALSGRRR